MRKEQTFKNRIRHLDGRQFLDQSTFLSQLEFSSFLFNQNNQYLMANGLSEKYNQDANELLEYTKKYLTTEYTAKLILNA